MPSQGMPSAAVEFQDPLGDVVEEVAVVGDQRRRCPDTPGGGVPARRRSRRRGGSSARRAAGCRAARSRILQRATRRRSPPERVATSASPGGSRMASMAISSRRSRSQPLAASMPSWTSACSSSRRVHLVGVGPLGEPGVDLVEPRRAGRGTGARPSSTLPSTSFVGSSVGSCGKIADRDPRRPAGPCRRNPCRRRP